MKNKEKITEIDLGENSVKVSLGNKKENSIEYPENTITFTNEEEGNTEILKFTKDKIFIRGKEVDCDQDIIDGMRAWLTQWNFLPTQPEEREGLLITKDVQLGETVVIVDNEDLTLRVSVNPWTLRASDFKYNIKNGNSN